MAQQKLNVDIAGTISEFERLMKEFRIKNILYRIIFRGKGLEFDSFRDFSPDDDAGDIDWKTSYRANKLLVKQYVEERDLKIIFIMDVSENMVFGSTEKLKCEYAAELAAALAHLIINSNDAVGLILFNETLVKTIMPKKGMKQFNLFVDELSNPLIYKGDSKIKKSLDEVLDIIPSSINVVFLISDFIKTNEEISKTLELFSSRFETIAIMIKDPLDKTLPNVKGELILEDPSTKNQIIIDPSIARKQYEKIALEQEKKIKKAFSDSGVDILDLTTDKPIAINLSEFLRERANKRKYVMPKR